MYRQLRKSQMFYFGNIFLIKKKGKRRIRYNFQKGKEMKYFLILFLVNFLVLGFSDFAWAARVESPNKDVKGNVFLFSLEATSQNSSLRKTLSLLKAELQNAFKEKEELECMVIDSADPAAIAKQITSLDPLKLKNLGGYISIRFVAPTESSSNGALPALEVYHYPFPPIAKEHIESPEYSFKFGSDSALLCIHVYRNFKNEVEGSAPFLSKPMIKPAQSANPYLPRDILRKSAGILLPETAPPDAPSMKLLAEAIVRSVSGFYGDESYYVMGLLSERAQKHQKPENIEIRIHKYIYPDKDFSEEEKKKIEEETSQAVQNVTPFSSYLFFVELKKAVAPYTLKIIDKTKGEKDFWYELDQGSFVTSSLKGVVRTVPNKFEKYAPLENKYTEPKPSLPQYTKLDLVIEGATVFDGTRDCTRTVKDVGIFGEKIVACGDLKEAPRDKTINAKGLFLTPGFIDIHSHVDWNILEVPYAPSHIRQGITTVLAGNCSFSFLGVGSFYREVEKKGAAVNIGTLVGNRPVREKVIGQRKGQPKYSEVYREKELVDLAMEEGAFGMSTGLIYRISEEAYAWELAEMAKQAKPYGGFYASHVRGETDEVVDAVREAIYIGEIAEVPVQVSHMKVINRRNWGDMKRYLDVMKAARARGLDVTGDQYPWRASGPAAHYRLHRLLVRDAIGRETPEVVLLKDMPEKYKEYSGLNLISLLHGERITSEELINKLGLHEKSPVYATYLCLGEQDVCLPMKEDFVMVCTDASLVSLKDIESGKIKNDHPRKFRTYPEFFGKYVREKKVCSWELGVYKCTGLPAKRMKLKDRGIIKPGVYADLVLFDPEKIGPGTDYRDQTRLPEGIQYVFLNGKPALEQGKMTKIRGGKALRAYENIKP